MIKWWLMMVNDISTLRFVYCFYWIKAKFFWTSEQSIGKGSIHGQPTERTGVYPLVNKHSYWKWSFIVDLPKNKWWFSIVMLVYQRVSENRLPLNHLLITILPIHFFFIHQHTPFTKQLIWNWPWLKTLPRAFPWKSPGKCHVFIPRYLHRSSSHSTSRLQTPKGVDTARSLRKKWFLP